MRLRRKPDPPPAVDLIGTVGEVYADRKANPTRGVGHPHIFNQRRGDVIKIHRAPTYDDAVELRERVVAGEVPW